MDHYLDPEELLPPQGLDDHLVVLHYRILHSLLREDEPLLLLRRFNGMTTSTLELINRIAWGDFTDTNMAELYLRMEDQIQNLASGLDDGTRHFIVEFTTHLSAQLFRTWTASLPARNLLDNLTHINAASMTSTAPGSTTLACSICLDSYLPSDTLVVLPCHTTHHFHRRCIHVRILLPSSLPG